ncbi:hypothetical protein AGMMS49942_01700 [Spirochaetia bacterium]|nr:hypothetical protein AGMMS49942_01700 [Spirochaetia bacterium]
MGRRKVKIPQKHREVLTLNEQQVAYLMVHGTAMGYPQDFVDRYAAGTAIARVTLGKVENKDTKNHQDVLANTAAIKKQKGFLVEGNERYLLIPPCTEENLDKMGAAPEATEKTKENKPKGIIRIGVENPARCQVRLRLDWDPTSQADPNDEEATHEIHYRLDRPGVLPPAGGYEQQDLGLVINDRKLHLTISVPQEYSGGTMYVSGRFLNHSGKPGDFCAIVVIIIT